MFTLLTFLSEVELFDAPTQKKEATEKLHMPKFLEREVYTWLLIARNIHAGFISFRPEDLITLSCGWIVTKRARTFVLK
jgi:hypothetical protein